jgi:GDSL-like protein
MRFISLTEFSGALSNRLHISGRTGCSPDGSPFLNPLTLFWTASGIECAVTEAELYADIECDYKCYRPWISVWINGKRTARFAPEKGRSRICLLESPAPLTRIQILKESQAMAGDSAHRFCIHGFFTNSEKAVPDIFMPLEPKKYLFECIGDSLTCGEGLEDPIEGKEWNSAWQGTRNHFAMILSQRFNADISIIAQSGWGLLCGWNNDPHCTIPPLYPFVCSLAKGTANREAGASQAWDFSRHKTDAVIINLGSNDEYAFRAAPWEDPASGKTYKLHGDADYARLKAAAKNFIGEIRRHNPQALIIWCYGMFLTGCMDLFRSAVEEFRAETGDDKVRFIELSPMDDTTAGAQKHPGPLCHKEAADLLTKTLSEKGFF